MSAPTLTPGHYFLLDQLYWLPGIAVETSDQALCHDLQAHGLVRPGANQHWELTAAGRQTVQGDGVLVA
ncbi:MULTISPECIES: hypothetical protein [Dyella]|uniref:Uncharacterized protein n=2 Tax=Dyella TaxID=231454 RepID=A0A4R0YJ61_9GAMM|nr:MULTISPECIES: hypothetical protein [Dyella]TBR36449.1 hypothetical protein EYV96_10920 [Dyella terrae]TCI08459.1 hypothetical protein EZM97_27950 [Dyella soli]